MQILINNRLLNNDKNNSNIDAIIYENLNDCRIKKDDFVFGTIEDYSKIQNMCNCSFLDFKVSDWLPFLKNEYVNWDGYFKQVWQLNETDIGKFCRSNSGKKIWAGQIIKSAIDIDTIHQCCMEDELLYLSDAKNIINEKRFWIINGNIVDFSHYYNSFNNNENVDNQNEEAISYVTLIIDMCYEPATKYVMDIGFDVNENQFKVIEYNCFNTSGFYEANINKIINDLKCNL